jgi:putative transposase
MYYRSEYPPHENCYHFTAATKYRKSVFTEPIRDRLAHHIREKAASLNLKVHAVAVAVNHVHILVQGDVAPPKISQFLFGYTSRLIRKEFPELVTLNAEQLWGGKACTNIKNQEHLENATAYINRHDPNDTRVE